MKFTSLVATGVLAVAGASSSFAANDLGPIPPSATFSNVVSGAFTDTWNFNLGSQSLVGVVLSNVEVTFGSFSFGGINGLTAFLNGTQLFGPTSTQTTSGITTKLQVLGGGTSLPAGVYSLVVSGTGITGSSATYSGSISATPISAVPEPQTYLMLLAGLGVMGAIARRRNNANSD
jgi:hypothetical protein